MHTINLENAKMHFNSDFSGNVQISGQATLNIPGNQLVDLMRHIFMSVTDDQRLELISQCCKHCGKPDTYCQCWHDE